MVITTEVKDVLMEWLREILSQEVIFLEYRGIKCRLFKKGNQRNQMEVRNPVEVQKEGIVR